MPNYTLPYIYNIKLKQYFINNNIDFFVFIIGSFSTNPPLKILELASMALGVSKIMQYEKYLGFPSLVGKYKKASFNYIKERVWRKLQVWEGRLLSQAGREVLINFVIQAIPTCTVGCFKIPLGFCHEIEALIKKFWWGQRVDCRKIYWLR